MCEFRKRLKEGVVLLDGGMGTMVQDILAPGENPALLSIRAPEQIEAIHRAYFQAGADVVYANTFGAGVLKLEGSGYTTEEITAASVAAASGGQPHPSTAWWRWTWGLWGNCWSHWERCPLIGRWSSMPGRSRQAWKLAWT